MIEALVSSSGSSGSEYESNEENDEKATEISHSLSTVSSRSSLGRRRTMEKARRLVREYVAMGNDEALRAMAIAKYVYNNVATGSAMDDLCPGQPGWINGYVLGPGYNDCSGCGDTRDWWFVPVGRGDMDSVFCSFNPGTDAARRNWYGAQVVAKLGAAEQTKRPTLDRRRKRRGGKSLV